MDDRSVLAQAARNFISDLDAGEFRTVVSSLRNWRGKADDLVKRYGAQAGVLISAVASKYGLGDVSGLLKERELRKPAVEDYLRKLLSIASKLGFVSTYVLVDRIDETALTQNDAKASFDIIRALLTDLHVLETPKLAFKFFLWDQIEPFYVLAGGRADRVPNYRLQWTRNELDGMLEKRLGAFSNQSIVSFNDLVDANVSIDVHKLLVALASGSPRDMIRMCGAIVDNHIRLKDEPGCIREASINIAVKEFSEQRSSEMYPSVLDELRRSGSASFTISKLASDVFRISNQAMGRKIQIWTNSGAVVQSGELPFPGSRPQNLYSLVDPKLCICVMGTRPLNYILEQFVFVCPECEAINVFEHSEKSCKKCRAELDDTDNMLAALSKVGIEEAIR